MDNPQFKPGNLVYDLFGYFLPGFFLICLVVIDFDLGKILEFYFKHGHSLKSMQKADISYKLQYLFKFLTWNTDSEFKFTTLFILVIFCYLIGHVIAAISSLLLETLLNKFIFGFPSKNLLDASPRKWYKKILPNYTRSFDRRFIYKFTKVFKDRFGNIPPRKAGYWLCFSEISMKHPVALNRTMHFLSLYGFSRNVSACFLIYSISRVMLSFFTHVDASGYNYFINALFFFIGIIMFKNYLKLYYRQCAELYYHFYALRNVPKNSQLNT